MLIESVPEFAPEKRWVATNKATVMRGLLAFALVALFFTAGILVTFAVADFQREQYFEVRKFQAAAAAASVEASDIQALTGSGKDVGTPAFEKLRQQLKRIKNSDARIRFVYLMRPQDGKMVFLADAENPASRDYSPPGRSTTRPRRRNSSRLRASGAPTRGYWGPSRTGGAHG